MQRYEYKVMPAPARAEKVKGLKRTGERFAHGVSALMNEMAAQGWEYLRAETLPCEEKKGFMRGSTTSQQSLLVFRRALPGAQVEQPEAARAPAPGDRAAAAQPPASPPEPVPDAEMRLEAAEPPLQGETTPRQNGPDTDEPILRADKSAMLEPTRRLSLSLDKDEEKSAPLTASRTPDSKKR